MTLALRYAARSDRGLVRANNEDSVYAGPRLLALADGMGGHAAGEVASQLVIGALAPLDNDEPSGDMLSQLNAAVHQGNATIAAQVETDPALDGMGTTLTAILFAGNRLGLVHIGDSRGYLLRDGELTQITKDDTFVQTLVDEGRITAEEAHSHPQRSLIMRALTGHEVDPTLTMREALVGDRYLLCSDGLSDPVSFETIQDVMRIPDVEKAADKLIEMALKGGGPDNVTVVVAEVIDSAIAQTVPILLGAVSGIDDQTAPPNTAAGRASAFNPRRNAPPKPSVEPAPPPAKRRSGRRYVFAAILVVLLLVAALGAGYYFVRSNYYVAQRAGDDNIVYLMRGLPGSLLNVTLADPSEIACLENDRGDVRFISVGDPRDGCRVLKVDDLDGSGQQQVKTGLQGGSVDHARQSLKDLIHTSLLPVCPPAPRAPELPSLIPPSEAPAGPAPEDPTRVEPREQPHEPPDAPNNAPTTVPPIAGQPPAQTPPGLTPPAQTPPPVSSPPPSSSASPGPTSTEPPAAQPEGKKQCRTAA